MKQFSVVGIYLLGFMLVSTVLFFWATYIMGMHPSDARVLAISMPLALGPVAISFLDCT